MAYQRDRLQRKSDFERAELAKDKTGVCIDGLTGSKPCKWKRDSDLDL